MIKNFCKLLMMLTYDIKKQPTTYYKCSKKIVMMLQSVLIISPLENVSFKKFKKNASHQNKNQSFTALLESFRFKRRQFTLPQ